MKRDIERSERYGFSLGIKLVRGKENNFPVPFYSYSIQGAYVESERALAKSLDIEDPINPTIEITHAMYDDAVEYVAEKIESAFPTRKLGLVVATHNIESIKKAGNKYK